MTRSLKADCIAGHKHLSMAEGEQSPICLIALYIRTYRELRVGLLHEYESIRPHSLISLMMRTGPAQYRSLYTFGENNNAFRQQHRRVSGSFNYHSHSAAASVERPPTWWHAQSFDGQFRSYFNQPHTRCLGNERLCARRRR